MSNKVYNGFIKTDEGLVPIANNIFGSAQKQSPSTFEIDFSRPNRSYVLPLGINIIAPGNPMTQRENPRSLINQRHAGYWLNENGFYHTINQANNNRIFRLNKDTLEVIFESVPFTSIHSFYVYEGDIYLVGRRELSDGVNFRIYRLDGQTLDILAQSPTGTTTNGNFFTYVQFTRHGLYYREAEPNNRAICRLHLQTLELLNRVNPPAANQPGNGFAVWDDGIFIIYRANATDTTSFFFMVYHPTTFAVTRSAIQFGTNVNLSGNSAFEVWILGAHQGRIYMTVRRRVFGNTAGTITQNTNIIGSISIAGLQDVNHTLKHIPEVQILAATPSVATSGHLAVDSPVQWYANKDGMVFMPALNTWSATVQGANQIQNNLQRINPNTGVNMSTKTFWHFSNAPANQPFFTNTLQMMPPWNDMDISRIVIRETPQTTSLNLIDNTVYLFEFLPLDRNAPGGSIQRTRLLAKGICGYHNQYVSYGNRLYGISSGGIDLYILEGV
ncbi:MAG: hypothetical protein FWD01_04045 [Defluviitaleaceae bacterium]|nr:hypothetical protein [Defluviitaleaceae bacterium]